ncbi:MAG: putative extracellular nuclease [Bacteroidia bacterium]|jgi:predicted extracellular nuclease
MKSTLLTFLAIAITFNGLAQKSSKKASIVFYNVENLFDIENDSTTFDDDFTPEGKKEWTLERYNKKLTDLASVIYAANDNDAPDLIGLCEVENKKVVEDLMNSGDLGSGGYAVIHEDSPDRRGIDVAFAYKRNVFRYMEHQAYSIYYKEEPETTTRDILHVKGMMYGAETHVFVNHWSSRRGGQEASEFKRLKAASILRGKADSVLVSNPTAMIIAMGDFNDHPDNKSMTNMLDSDPDGIGPLRNLAYQMQMDSLGTYNYKGVWGMLDQFLVSKNIERDGSAKFEMSIYKDPSILYEDPKKGPVPNRTYAGPKYVAGFSDHLPIKLEIAY